MKKPPNKEKNMIALIYQPKYFQRIKYSLNVKQRRTLKGDKKYLK